MDEIRYQLTLKGLLSTEFKKSKVKKILDLITDHAAACHSFDTRVPAIVYDDGKWVFSELSRD